MTAAEPSALLVRAVALYGPMLLVIALIIQVRPNRRRLTGALLAVCWNVPALLALNLVAVRAGWWRFEAGSASVAGIPADLWLGWALLWGAVPVLATRRLALAGLLLVAFDLVLMPLGEPVVVLGRGWLVGEAVAAATCLVPGLLLGRWTAEDERVVPRAVLQVGGFTGIVFFVMPAIAFTVTVTGDEWGPLLERPRWHFVLAAVLLAPVGALALQAVAEFAAAGGTPVPFDPPKALVTSGPYAYLANPMQVAATILLAAWGLLLSSPAVTAAAVMAAVFSAGFATWSEDGELDVRFGDGWRDYRRRVRVWLPRWRPAMAGSAVVYVAASCEPCQEVGRFLAARQPVGLDVRPAEQCPFPLQRITYERDGRRVAGVAAVARSLEHANLAWATLGWIGRLPVVLQVLQLVADAVGFGPRPVHRPASAGGEVQEAPPSPAS